MHNGNLKRRRDGGSEGMGGIMGRHDGGVEKEREGGKDGITEDRGE